MSTKLHSGLKRTLAWLLTAAMLAQGCFVVSADDFSSEPVAAQETQADTQSDAEAVDFDTDAVETTASSDDVTSGEEEIAAPDVQQDADVEDISQEADSEELTAPETTDDNAAAEQNTFDDGSAVAAFSDGTETQDATDDTSRIEKGSIQITSDKSYDYTRIKDLNGYYRWAVANYPSNNSTINMCVGETRVGTLHALYTSTNSKELKSGLVWDKKDSNSSLNWTSSNTDVVTVEQYWANTDIKAVGIGEADITGTWIGYDKSASSSSKTELGRIVVTYHVKVTEPPAAVNLGTDKIELQGEPSSPELLESAGKIRFPWTLEDSWGSSAHNTYVDVTASDKDGMQKATAVYNAYLSSGVINHVYKLDFHEMTKDALETYSSSPKCRSGNLKETFVRPVKVPADGIYLIGTTQLKIAKRSNTATISVQVFKDGAQTTTKPDFEFEFSDPSVAEVSKQSFSSSSYNTTLTVKALAPGSTTMTIKCGDLAVKTLEIDVNGVKITEPDKKIAMSLDDETKEHQVQYVVYDFTKENPDVTNSTEVKWKIKDTSIAAIDTDGGFRIKKPGETTIEASASVNNYSDTDSVTLTVTGSGSLQLDKDELKLKKDGKETIKATASYNGTNVTNAEITWGSENEKVATVDAQGNVTAVGYGTTQITASWKAENGKTYSGKVTVNVVYDGLYVSADQSEVTLTQNGTMEIVWQLENMGEYVAGKTGKSSGYNSSSKVTWTSEDEEVATVDKYGVIVAGTKNGQTIVKASYKDDNNNTTTKEIKVTVVDCQVVKNGETIDLTGTVGVDGGEHTWKNGYYENGHKSLGAQFWNTEDNINAAGTTATAKVTGKIPALNPVGITHGFYVSLESLDGPCTSYETIRVKVDGAEGLYLDNSSIETTVGASARPSIIGKVYDNDELVQSPTVKYKAEDESIVRLEEMPNNKAACYVVGIAPGKTVVTGTWGSFSATCDVTVTSDKRIILSPSYKLSVLQNGTETITAKAWDGSKYVDDAAITWESYDESIVTVKDGVVTGVERGSAAVVAKWDDLVSSPVQVTVLPSRNVTVSTEWDDHDNQDGIRPEKATLQLTANNKKVGDPVELNADNNWTYELKVLQAEDEKGNNIVYRVTAEDPNEEYTAKVTGSADDGFVVTYSHEIAKVSATANVTWDDAENQDGIRPASVSLQLKSKVEGEDAVNVGDNVTVKADADGNWTKTWTDLPKYNAGKVIEYTVEESGLPEGYTATVSKDEETGAITVKNSHTPAVKDLTVSAKWDDADNQDGVRPASVDAVLYAGGTTTDKTVTLTAEENWTATIKDMPVYTAGKVGEAVNYSLKVAKEVEDYTSTTDGLAVTFTHKPAVTSVTTTIKWDDAENQDGIRPASVTLQLKADGEAASEDITVKADANGNWTKTWNNLPVNKAGAVGQKVTYTVEQTGLRSEYTQATAGDATTGFTITNSYTPKGVDIAVSANWDDQDNQDGIRPEAVEAELYADNVSTNKKVRLTADTDWKATFEKLAVNKNGKPINYTLQATKVDGYDLTTSGSGAEGLVLKYTHKVKAVDVTATVKWADGDNQDGIRPASITLQLKADGENSGDPIAVNANSNWTKKWSGLAEYKAGKKVVYTVGVSEISDYTVEITGDAATGFTVTATHVPAKAEVKASVVWDDADNQDGIRPEAVEAEIYAGDVSNSKKVRLTADNNWTASFGEMELKKDGQEIKYTLVGTKADGYTYTCTGSGAAGLVLTYTHKPEVVSVSVNTTWNDKNNQDGQRPGAYSVQLKADGKAVGDVITLNSSNSFAKVWKDLPKYKVGKVGVTVKYEVAVTDLDSKYETRTEADGNTFNVTNTYIPETVQIPVSVKWDDANNQDGKRLDSVEAELYAEGQATGNKVTLDEKNSWKASFAKVDVKKDGKRINYTVKTTENKDYTITTTGNVLDDNGVVVTYKHVPETVNVSIKSTWNDANNQDGIRPATISVQLMKDDKEEGDNINLKIASPKTWSNLPKYANGKEIKYAVAISDVSGYTKKVTGSVADGYVAAFTHSVYKTSVVVQNTWSDLDNALLTRPSSLNVQIYANGKATSKKVVLNSANKWKATVSGLNKNSAGKKITYSAKLVKTPTGYKVTIGRISSKGTIAIKNTYTKFTKKLTVKISPTKVTYNGKTRKPAVKSVYYGKTKLSSRYYTVSFKNNKNPGIGSVIVKGKGKYAKYAGSATFSILPKAPTGLTAKSTAKKQATVTWKGSTGATGYQIMISQKSDFRKGTTRTFTIRDSKRRSGVPKPMTSGRTYYIRIRSYKTTSNGKTVYSAWSKSTKTKIK